MAESGSSSSTSKALGLAFIGAVAVATAVWWWQSQQTEPDGVAGTPAAVPAASEPAAEVASQEPEPDPEPVEEVAAVEPDPATEPAPEEVTEPLAGTPEPPQEPVAPEFDVVRVEEDGRALVAGRAAPGATVSIELDGEVVGQAEADRTGGFVSILDFGPSDDARVVSLSTETEADTPVESTQSVILAPVVPQEPVVTEAPETEADETPVETAEAETDPASDEGTVVATAEDPAPETPTVEAAPAAPTVLLADGDGVRVLQGANEAPEAQQSVTVDTITYNTEGDVVLSGRGLSDESFVRVYIDNNPIRELQIEEGGDWRTPLPDVDTGVYTLRIDEIDPGTGRVTSRIETPFKREPAAAILALAADVRETARPVELITIQPGNTLWQLSEKAYGDGGLFVRIFEANADRIKDPDLIYPGQVFSVPN